MVQNRHFPIDRDLVAAYYKARWPEATQAQVNKVVLNVDDVTARYYNLPTIYQKLHTQYRNYTEMPYREAIGMNVLEKEFWETRIRRVDTDNYPAIILKVLDKIKPSDKTGELDVTVLI